MNTRPRNLSSLVALIIDKPWLRLRPGRDTYLALATVLYFIPVYYLGAYVDSRFAFINFLFATSTVLVILPAYYMLKVVKEPLSEIGFTRRRLIPSLALSALLISRYSPMLQKALNTIPEANVIPHLIYCGACLWEPFFIHCWVQNRFDKAFGIIPGIIAAGACTALYHIGTYPTETVVLLGFLGLFYGVIFRATRNIFALWPFTWAGAAAMGTIWGGFVFGWWHVALYGSLLLVQLICILYFSLSGRG